MPELIHCCSDTPVLGGISSLGSTLSSSLAFPAALVHWPVGGQSVPVSFLPSFGVMMQIIKKLIYVFGNICYPNYTRMLPLAAFCHHSTDLDMRMAKPEVHLHRTH